MLWFKKKKKATNQEIKQEQARELLEKGLISVRDLIAPALLALKPTYMQLNGRYAKTIFVLTYPQYIEANWLSPIINFDISFDISMHIYP